MFSIFRHAPWRNGVLGLVLMSKPCNQAACIGAAACAILLSLVNPGRSQESLCVPPSRAVFDARGGMACQCPDGSLAAYYGCAQPQYVPQQAPRRIDIPKWQPTPAPPKMSASKALLHVESALGKALMSMEPVRKDIPLSGQVGQERVAAPKNYKSPFDTPAANAARDKMLQSSPSSSSQPPMNKADPFSSNVGNISSTTPSGGATQQTSDAPKGSYAACVGTNSFYSSKAWCESGGYVYFQNGSVMKAH